jgi:hypothetical protein
MKANCHGLIWSHALGRLREILEALHQDSQCSDGDSNRIHSE